MRSGAGQTFDRVVRVVATMPTIAAVISNPSLDLLASGGASVEEWGHLLTCASVRRNKHGRVGRTLCQIKRDHPKRSIPTICIRKLATNHRYECNHWSGLPPSQLLGATTPIVEPRPTSGCSAGASSLMAASRADRLSRRIGAIGRKQRATIRPVMTTAGMTVGRPHRLHCRSAWGVAVEPESQ